MKEKTRKIFIMIVMAALIVSLMAASFAALTYGRYSGGRRDENSPYEDYIDFVGATAYEVRTPEQFVNAINNGYSYIKIAADAEEPFVVNNDIANVYTNLVIDVNGKTVIRNSRNPVLDVRRSISVVLVYDSSVEGSGGFYNPVGSALQTSGGSLTVGSGSYESGPKVKGSSSFSSDTSVTLYTRTSRTAGSYETKVEDTSMPSLSGDVYYTGDTTQYTYIENDTYLLYTEVKNAFVGKGETSDDATFESGQLYVNCKEFTTDGTQTTYSADIFAPDSNVASCDFYYYYPIDESGAYSSTAGTVDSPKTYAVVYGYNDVKGLAEDEDDNNDGIGEATALIDDGLVWPYAAIRSVEDGEVGGVTHARGGTFTTNFGTDNTYGIYSVGGTMTVGTDSASTPPKFTATGEGTCIGMSAGENDTLTIASGNFSSQVGDTILMRGGEMTVTGGTFTKTGSHPVPTGNPTATDYAASRTALIHMLGGDLTVNGTVGTDTSVNPTYSVNMTAGSTDAPLTNVFGIYSTETTDETTGKAVEGTVTVSGCKITVNGTYSAGVLSSAGTVNVGGTENGKADTDITVANSILNDRLTSSAVSSEGGIINLQNTVNILSDSLGITARGTINVGDETTQAAANVTVNTENATGVYVNNGTLNVNAGATLGVTSTVRSNTKWVQPPEGQTEIPPSIYNGVYVNGGSLVSEGTLNVTFTGVQNEESGTYLDQQIKSYAVRVEAAAAGDDTEVKITAGTIINQVQYDEQGKEIAGGGGGVYVGGGTVTLGKQETTNGVTTYSGPTVQTTGELLFAKVTKNEGLWPWSETTYTWEGWKKVVGDSWKYMLNKSGGHAVEVSGGSLTVHGGDYTAQQGNGILIRNTSQSQATNTVKINSGSFLGYNGGYYIDYGHGQTPLGSDRMVGPAASYGLNVMGHGLNVTINGGTFGEAGSTGNSAASFFGTPVEGTSDEIKESRPQVAVHGGTFNANNADAISVFRFIDITFDGEVSSEVSGETDVASLSVQNDLLYTGESARGSTITIQSGTFTGTAYGIWYGSSTDKLNIYGGTFQGDNRSGLYFEVNQWNNAENKGNTFITGGTFIGRSSQQGDSWNRYWINGAIGAPSSGISEGVGFDIQIVDFIDCNSGKSIYYFEDSDSQQADNVTALSWYANNKDNRDVNKINQTTCKYNKVIIQ